MRRSFAVGVVFALVLASTSAATHKYRVRDAAATASLLAHGGRLIADYGSFQLVEADPTIPLIAAARQIQVEDHSNLIELNAARLDTRDTKVKARRAALGAFAGRRLHLIHFAGPVKPEWREALVKRGLRVVCYIPNNAYLVYGDAKSLGRMQAWAGTNVVVQWEGGYADGYKISPRARAGNAVGRPATDLFAIQLVEDAEANADTLVLIDQLKLAPVRRQSRALGYLNVIVRLPANKLDELAGRPEVVSVQPYVEPRKFCERQAQIMAGNVTGSVPDGPGYLAWLGSKGFAQEQFDASGLVVDVTDSGIDNGTSTPYHFGLFKTGSLAFTSRVAYNRLEGSANGGSSLEGCDGHGNLNAHIIAGYDDRTGAPFADASGYHYGLGICPFVKVGSSVIFDPDYFTYPIYDDLISRAYRDGARVSGNSWGSPLAGDYDVVAQNYDALVRDAQPGWAAVTNAGNQEMVIVFAAGNEGPAAGTVGSPGTAKNVFTVGAAENVQAFGGPDGSGVSDIGANSADDIINFSSRGPCADGRKKPDLCAPGTHVSGGVAQSASPGTNGTANACFNGSGVSGGVSSIYFPSVGQQFYTASSGTSHATPGVAGACALLRQYFINHSMTPPSPAMTKAYMMNAARYLNGNYANDTLPSDNQGMGGVNLGMAFDGVARVARDQTASDRLTASGQTRTIVGTVSDVSKPFRVTVAWTDAPGNTFGGAYNNDLDLTVTVGGQSYKGNVFNGDSSTNGGSADLKNNVESVFLPAGVSGDFLVTVTAANINSDGVPNNGDVLDQDYALVIYNATETPVPALSIAGVSLAAEGCGPTNGAIDSGETVTVHVALKNLGTANTTNVVATLLALDGVTAPSGEQTYGALTTNGNTVTQAFSFTATGNCGGNITPTLLLQDGVRLLGSNAWTAVLGNSVTIRSETFDSVIPSGLPVGWTTSAGAGQSAWVTTTTQRDTLPNAAYSSAPETIGSNDLVSAVIDLPNSASQLVFRHRYDFETGFDGGVLEIKIGAGAFTDILAAGGSFVAGGYNNIISTYYGSPLGGRQAWSGDNGGFATVVVNLPITAAGQNIWLRWRCGTDQGISATGWWVDTTSITGYLCCNGAAMPLITNQPQNQVVLAAGEVDFIAVAYGESPLSYQWYFNSNAIDGVTGTNCTITNVQAGNEGSYFVIVTNPFGAATSSVATLTIATPPVILTNPVSLTIGSGGKLSFSVTATSSVPLAYQWQRNGGNIPAANSSTYAKASVQPGDTGYYTAVVTNLAGLVTSAPALLTVTSAPASAPTFVSPLLVSNHLRFMLTGTPGSNYIITVSTNLATDSWIPLQTNAAPFLFIDSNAYLFRERYYRSILMP